MHAFRSMLQEMQLIPTTTPVELTLSEYRTDQIVLKELNTRQLLGFFSATQSKTAVCQLVRCIITVKIYRKKKKLLVRLLGIPQC